MALFWPYISFLFIYDGLGLSIISLAALNIFSDSETFRRLVGLAGFEPTF